MPEDTPAPHLRPVPPLPFLTTAELAERWRRAPKTLANARSRGKGVRFVKILGVPLYPVEEVLAAERGE